MLATLALCTPLAWPLTFEMTHLGWLEMHTCMLPDLVRRSFKIVAIAWPGNVNQD